MKEYLEFYFYKIIKILFLHLPRTVDKVILKLLVPVIKSVQSKRHRLMIKNLKFVFPEKTNVEILKIADNVWYNIGLTFLDALIYTFRPWKIKLVVKNYSSIKNVLENNKNGLILFTGHIGNWELFAHRIALEGYKIAAVVRKLRNNFVDTDIKTIRESMGAKIFNEHEVNNVFLYLKKGWIVYLVPDQHIVEGNLRVNFLGKLAFTSPLIVLLSKRTRTKIFPVFCIRKNDEYEMIVEKEFSIMATGNLKDDLKINTERINEIIGKYVKLYPEQWMWLHNRWREK